MPAVAEFADRVAATPMLQPHTTVIGNVDASPLATVEAIRAELVAQLTAPVRWTASIKRMIADGATRFLEIGPGSVLTGLVKRIDPTVETGNAGTPDDMREA